jgi:hypothetical protein
LCVQIVFDGVTKREAAWGQASMDWAHIIPLIEACQIVLEEAEMLDRSKTDVLAKNNACKTFGKAVGLCVKEYLTVDSIVSNNNHGKMSRARKGHGSTRQYDLFYNNGVINIVGRFTVQIVVWQETLLRKAQSNQRFYE